MTPRREWFLTWLSGPVLALAGVALVRLLAPRLAGRAQALVLVAGYLLVPAGLFLFARQLGRRAAARSVAAEPADDERR